MLRAKNKPTLPTRLDRELETNPFLRPARTAIRAKLGMLYAPDWKVFAGHPRAQEQELLMLTRRSAPPTSSRSSISSRIPRAGTTARRFAMTRGEGGRAASTAIYFLLAAGEVSHWHRVDAAEAWHWHAGAPLSLSIAPPDGGTMHIRARRRARSRRAAAGGRARRATGRAPRASEHWTLVGCTVAPGFVFEGFDLAPDGFAPPRAEVSHSPRKHAVASKAHNRAFPPLTVP